jgi:hypothetical protein
MYGVVALVVRLGGRIEVAEPEFQVEVPFPSISTGVGCLLLSALYSYLIGIDVYPHSLLILSYCH